MFSTVVSHRVPVTSANMADNIMALKIMMNLTNMRNILILPLTVAVQGNVTLTPNRRRSRERRSSQVHHRNDGSATVPSMATFSASIQGRDNELPSLPLCGKTLNYQSLPWVEEFHQYIITIYVCGFHQYAITGICGMMPDQLISVVFKTTYD